MRFAGAKRVWRSAPSQVSARRVAETASTLYVGGDGRERGRCFVRRACRERTDPPRVLPNRGARGVESSFVWQEGERPNGSRVGRHAAECLREKRRGAPASSRAVRACVAACARMRDGACAAYKTAEVRDKQTNMYTQRRCACGACPEIALFSKVARHGINYRLAQ